MVRNAMQKAEPPVGRFAQTVQEHEILRVGGKLLKASESVDKVRWEILKWAQKHCGNLPAQAWEYKPFEHLAGGRNCSVISLETNTAVFWALRAEDPDKNVPGRVWTTEVVLVLPKDDVPRFSMRLLVNTREAEIDIEPHTPGFVLHMLRHASLVTGTQGVHYEPWILSKNEEISRLVDMLTEPNRRLPIFVLTTYVFDGVEKSWLDPRDLARATTGIARIVVVPDRLTRLLTQRLGKARTVYDGAIRAYLPGFTLEGDSYMHRLILSDRLATSPAQYSKWVRNTAAAESVKHAALGKEILSFASIRDAGMKLRQQELERRGASDTEKLKAAQDRVESLERRTQELEGQLVYFDEEHQKAEARAEASDEQYRAAVVRIQQLLALKGSAEPIAPSLPRGWNEFAGWCDQHLLGKVVLSPAAKRSVRAPEYLDVELAAKCLLWLADTCRPRRMGDEGGKPLSEEPIFNGVRNSHCGGDAYEVTWQGQRHTVDWHIKCGGTTRDPKRCLRIYYFWDSAQNQIVIADMPAHRRTGAS